MNDVFGLMDEWGPEKVVCVSDRRTGMKGVLVIDNTARGMGKGGTRMRVDLQIGEVARLARAMTWKWAAVDLFYGGAKAGIMGDPTSGDKEGILRAFARALRNEVPSEYVFGLDVGLNEKDAAIFLDELGDRSTAVGLPRALGGLPYDELGVTGHGVAEAADAAAAAIDLPMSGARVAVQGFGAVGLAASRRLVELGAVVVAVATASGTLVDPDGIDVGALAELKADHGDDCVKVHGEVQDPAAVMEVDVDILIPAALEDVLDEDLAKRINTKLVVEGANLPTTDGARHVLHERAIAVIPDFIANAGGVVAAAHSMDARTSAFPVEPDAVMEMVSAKMRANAVTVLEESARSGVHTKAAAQALAQRRVREAMQLRGQIRP